MKIAKQLTQTEFKKLTKEEGTHCVGGVRGLLFRVTRTGKSWILRIQIGSKRRDMGLGSYPEVSLKEARESAAKFRSLVRMGRDPIEEKRAERNQKFKVITFEEAAKETHMVFSVKFRSAKHTEDWINSINKYANPVIGKLPVSEITDDHILQILNPIWTEKTQTASRLRGRMEKVFTWTIRKGHRKGHNPAVWQGHLEIDLLKPSKIKVSKPKHFDALPSSYLSVFIKELRKREQMSAKALEFAILTAARSGEVRGATWDEIDLDNHVWIIPESRMKSGNEHRVPLSDAAMSLLKNIRRSEVTNLIFWSPRFKMLTTSALSSITKDITKAFSLKEDKEIKAVPHGFRSTFRDWCAEKTYFSREVIEMALAHSIASSVEAAYRRGDLFENRRVLMQEWADFINGGLKHEKQEAKRQ